MIVNSIKDFIGKLTGKPPNGFKLGDKVSWGGCIGTVINLNAPNIPMQVIFMGPKVVVGFYIDGRFLEWHKKADLKFIARQYIKTTLKPKEEVIDGQSN